MSILNELFKDMIDSFDSEECQVGHGIDVMNKNFDVENVALTAFELEQLVAFERSVMTEAGCEISKEGFRSLLNKRLVARVNGWTVLTESGELVLDRFRVMCRNLRISEIR